MNQSCMCDGLQPLADAHRSLTAFENSEQLHHFRFQSRVHSRPACGGSIKAQIDLKVHIGSSTQAAPMLHDGALSGAPSHLSLDPLALTPLRSAKSGLRSVHTSGSCSEVMLAKRKPL